MSDPVPSFAEVSEGVRATMAAYTQALDDGRTEDLIATFCPDGWCDLPGLGRHEGHDVLHPDGGAWRFHSRVAEFVR